MCAYLSIHSTCWTHRAWVSEWTIGRASIAHTKVLIVCAISLALLPFVKWMNLFAAHSLSFFLQMNVIFYSKVPRAESGCTVHITTTRRFKSFRFNEATIEHSTRSRTCFYHITSRSVPFQRLLAHYHYFYIINWWYRALYYWVCRYCVLMLKFIHNTRTHVRSSVFVLCH